MKASVVIGEGLLEVGGMAVVGGACLGAGVDGHSVAVDVVVLGALSETKSIQQSLLLDWLCQVTTHQWNIQLVSGPLSSISCHKRLVILYMYI